jgi:D-3-phosphoglycerate dehydrogenase
MKRVLVSDNLSNHGLDVIRDGDGYELDYQPGLDEAKLAEAIKSADALIIRSGSKVTARVIEAADKLKVIGRAGIGVDNIDIAAASKRGIAVMNTPTGNSVTTAEHTISLMMSLARWIPAATASMKAGKWEKKKFKGRELAGKTLAVIGLGTIGRIVANRAKGLAMRVIAFDPVITPDRASALGVELTDLDKIWSTADVITVHTPLTPKTKGLINADVVSKLKEGVLLVNCARGGIYDEDAVLAGLESGRIGGAAFDVYPVEPPPEGSAIIQHPRVVCTPHLGASTQEAQDRVAKEIAEQVSAFLDSGEIKNALNVPAMSGELAAKVAPYVELADKLGSFMAQVEQQGGENSPKSIEIECSGDAAELGTEAIVAAAVGGFLQRFLDVPVNAISAPHLAEDRGISVRELKTKAPLGKHASVVTVRIEDQDGKQHVASGTLGSDRSARLVRWGDFDIEAKLEGTALVVASLDKPGVIGFMGTTLGDAKINVASVFLGKSSQGHAMSMWNLDDDMPPEVLEAVQDSPNVQRAIVIHL